MKREVIGAFGAPVNSMKAGANSPDSKAASPNTANHSKPVFVALFATCGNSSGGLARATDKA